MTGTGKLRLMPWPDERGRACYLSTDNENGFLSRVADQVEATQLGMASDLLDHVDDLLSGEEATAEQLRYCVTQLQGSLRETLRVADSRGERLPAPDADAADHTYAHALSPLARAHGCAPQGGAQ
ncbi:hypothetical protein [Streptomyces alboflavus]|uniref:hypothetical protein n=1 Tax=Streptomyces alboflavus TaxID=67267 RepID=UPI0036821088